MLFRSNHLFRGNAGAEHLSLSANARLTHLPAPGLHGPDNGRVVNMPAHDRGPEHNFAHSDHVTSHAEHAERDVRHDDHNTRHEEHSVHHEEINRPREHFEHAQPARFNRFSDAQARMGGPRLGGPHFGGGGFFHRH